MARVRSLQLVILLAFFGVFTSVTANSFDYYVLGQTWYGTTCMFPPDGKSCNAWNGPTKSQVKHFNIHGLWPSNKTGKADYYCKPEQFANANKKLYTENFTTELRAALAANWSGVYEPWEGFVNHEWNKHGMCWEATDDSVTKYLTSPRTLPKQDSVKKANSLPARILKQLLRKFRVLPGRPAGPSQEDLNKILTKQTNYLKVTLKAAETINPYDYLFNHGIKPHATDAHYVFDMTSAFPVRPVFLCKVKEELKAGKLTNTPYLAEVLLCLDKEYQPIGCPESEEGLGPNPNRCSETQKVIYPLFQ